MADRAIGRAIAAIGAAILLVSSWPALSASWIAFVRPIAVAASGANTVYGPKSASATLAAAIVIMLALPLDLRRRLALIVATSLATFAVEFAFVVVGARLGLSASTMAVLGGLSQDMVPAAGVLLAARSSSWWPT